MLKALKKICISIVVLCICISPISNLSNVQASAIEQLNTAVKSSSTQTVSAGEATTASISREQICTSQESQNTGCMYAVHVGNVTYTHYYQARGFYKNDYLKHTGKDRTIARSGCGYTSCASILTGYGVEVSPRDTVKAMNSTFSANSQIATCMSKFGVDGQWIAGKTAKEYKERIEQALSEGKPVIALMSAAVGPDTFWTSGGHFLAIVGQDENYMWTCDSGYTAESHAKYTGKVAKASQYMRGVWIPSQAPSGSNSGESFVPSPENPSSGGSEVSPPSGGNFEATWEINNEIPDMDNLGDFKYKGNPKGMTMDGSTKEMGWTFKSIADFIDYILGMIFTVIKIAIVGTIENIERLINGLLLQIEQSSADGTMPEIDEIDEYTHYTIEDILYNRVPALDPNILSGTAGGVELEEGSTLGQIRTTIASWYVGFRNVSILIIFVMLIYTGLRMAITNVAKDKADFKQQLFTWLKCMVLAFTLHYIIFLVLNLNSTLVSIFDPANNTTNENILYNTIKTRAYDLRLSVGFTGTVMYIILFIYWIKFLLIYIKRLLKIVLLVVTAPFVIARYAMDNATGKGKKAYKDWLHDFVTNVLIQSLHALEYTILIGIAVDIASKSIAGFIIALIFMSQMLKFDEVILSILKFDGEDMGGRIKPLKEPLHLKTYLNYKYAQTAVKLTGKAAKTVGGGVSSVGRFANRKLKEATDIDVLGAASNAKTSVLNAKDDLLKKTIGSLSDELSDEYDLRITSREKDEKGKPTKRAKWAKKTLTTYKKEKKKRYKAQRKQFIGKSRFLSTAVGVGKFTIGTALMTQNLTAGMLMAGLTPDEIIRSIREHDKRKEEYEKNIQKRNELSETIRDVNNSNRLEDEIEEEISNMNEQKRKKALKELLQLSSLNGNTKVIEDSIKDYMVKHKIKYISNENIDKILESTFTTIDPNNTLTTKQRAEFVRELKKNLQIKREKEWRELTQVPTDTREQTEPRTRDEETHTEGDTRETSQKDRRSKTRETTDRRKQPRETQDRRSQPREKFDRRETKEAESQIEQSRETFVSSFTREDVSNMFSQAIQTGIVSKENQELGTKINQMQDINYGSIKRSKKKVNNTNKFIGELKNKYKNE